MRRAVTAATAVLLTLLPRLADACPACVSSPYGDRTYNMAYVGLLLAPFAVALVIGGVLAWSAGYRPDLARLRRALSRRTPDASHYEPKETT
jgi:hypothetical protein